MQGSTVLRGNSAERSRGSVTIAAAAVLLTWVIAAAPMSAATHHFIAVINGGQEVPPADSPALGNAFLTYDTATKMLCYAISFTDLIAPEAAAHFHGPASAGENAGVLFFITPGPSAVGSPKTGCVGPLDAKARAALNRGRVYINVHSSAFPGGEIRGQVIPVKGN